MKEVHYLAGCDIGTGGTKAVVIDLEGNVLGEHYIEYPLITKKESWENYPGMKAEHDPMMYWESVCICFKESIRQAKIDPAYIGAVSISALAPACICVDRNLKPLANGHIWMDRRGTDQAALLMEEFGAEESFNISANPIDPYFNISKFMWEKDNRADLYQKTYKVQTAADFPVMMLTGEAVTDYSNASLYGIAFDIRKRKWRTDILEKIGIDPEKLPEVYPCDKIIGEVTRSAASSSGLSPGTPVVAGLYDIDAAAVSTGVIDESKMNVIAGTWCNNQYVSKTPIISDRFFSTTVFSNPGYYLMLEGSPTSASNLEWFVGEFLQAENKIAKQKGTSVFDICNEAVKKTNPEDTDIVFVPFLYGSNAKPNAKSVILGLQGWHKREHVIRAIYEGICFSHKWHVDKLMEYREKPNAARFAGGASRSDVWLQMFADVLQMPMEITRAEELGTLGAAICGAVGIGVFESFDSASKKMVHVDRRFDPQKDKEEIYNRKFKRYKKAIKSLEDYWE